MKFTHNIRALSAAAESLGETLPSVPFPMIRLTEFAGEFRYAAPRDLTPIERDQIRETIRILRQHVQARLATLNEWI